MLSRVRFYFGKGAAQLFVSLGSRLVKLCRSNESAFLQVRGSMLRTFLFIGEIAMKSEVICAVVSVPVEMLRYKYNEAEDIVVRLKLKLSSIFQQSASDTVFTVMSNGEFGFPLWSLETALAVKGLGQSVKAEIVVPCDEQDECWAEERRTRYYKVIEKADAAPALPLEYTDLCDKTEDFYDAADRYMMTVCDMVIAITAGEEEPEALVYARDKGKPIMYIDADTLEIRQ